MEEGSGLGYAAVQRSGVLARAEGVEAPSSGSGGRGGRHDPAWGFAVVEPLGAVGSWLGTGRGARGGERDPDPELGSPGPGRAAAVGSVMTLEWSLYSGLRPRPRLGVPSLDCLGVPSLDCWWDPGVGL